ncbi:MAG: sigma-70 family RNA polymerase sigma factor [Gammaproteobacteria bacterium]|nr:sigma-70 family RNA polymerase sigma factor [Gammaproteobacteria bacterium]
MLPHLDAAYRFARWLGNTRADAEDIVQEAMLRAFRAHGALRGEPRPWLLTIVRNCHVDAHRERQRETSGRGALRDEPLAGFGPDPQLAAIQSQGEAQLQRLLGELTPEQREVLALRELAELSYREIAALLAVPIGTVMSRLARARESLQEHWTREPDHGVC